MHIVLRSHVSRVISLYPLPAKQRHRNTFIPVDERVGLVIRTGFNRNTTGYTKHPRRHWTDSTKSANAR